ncbi:diguanylate cyclase domain-containing protein, partial [Enterococcus faecium]|uniref:diguanylate cyclase domain-containing protein n=1 Tax=Enterococcus faecium TaxID=1352 RepID=UPI00387A8AFC
MERLAFFDPLTGLPNRRLLTDRLHRAIGAAAHGREHGALLFLDLDNFKDLNDTLGHDMGDRLLVQAAQRLLSCVGPQDTV